MRSEGELSPMNIMVSPSGIVAESEAGVSSLRFATGKNISFEPTARELWVEVKSAVQLLRQGHRPADHLADSILNGQLIVMLITGFESFMKSRFIELEAEGVRPDINALVRAFVREAKMKAMYQAAKGSGRTIFQYLVSDRINFQSYDLCKDAYQSAYNIRISDLVGSRHVSDLKRFLQYRHRLIHRSPQYIPLNWDECLQGEDPVFANEATIERAVATIDSVITALNAKTLTLERS